MASLLVVVVSSGVASAQEPDPETSSDQPDRAAAVFNDAVEAHVERLDQALDARLREVAQDLAAEDLHPWIESELDVLRWIEAKARSGRHRQAIRRLGPLRLRLEDAAQRARAFPPETLSRDIERLLRSQVLAKAKLGGGGISGRVVDHVDGTPLADTVVALRSLGTDLLQTTVTDEAGNYELTDVAPGTYHVHTQSFTHRNESYDDRPCVSLICSVFYYTVEFSAGHAVTVESGTVTPSIDFALDPKPVIRGRVVHGETGEPRQGAYVEAAAVNNGSPGSAMTDADGIYEIPQLRKGHFLVTAFSGPLVGELYEDIPCYRGLSLDCFSPQGTPVFTDYRLPAEGVDFALSPGSGLQGRVSDENTGLGIPFAQVAILKPDGEIFFRAIADENGRYGAALPPGTYYVRAYARTYATELFDEVGCSYGVCELGDGAPIVIADGEDGEEVVAGVDFELAPSGRFSGTVQDVLGHALFRFEIRAYDTDGTYRARAFSAEDGSYSFPILGAGTYFAVASHTTQRTWQRQVYRQQPCSEPHNVPCSLGGATPIVVGEGQETTGIDFNLSSRQSVSGRVLDAETGDPVTGATVSVYRQDGVRVLTVTTDAAGFYRHLWGSADPLYLLATADDFIPQAFSSLPCPPQDCDPTLGQAIEVPADSELMQTDFQLSRGGGIEGTTHLAGEPLAQVTVSAYDDQGRLVATVESDAEGRYRVGGLVDGAYYLTMKFHGWTQIYPNRDCRFGCDPRAGDPLTVTDSTTRNGADFDLGRRAGIFGRITDTFDRPLSGVEIWLRDLALDEVIAHHTTGAGGLYAFDGLATGDYRISADKDTYAFKSVEPISAQEALGRTEVDLRLEHDRGIAGRVVAADSGLPVPLVAIDIWDENGELYSQGLTSADGRYSVFVPDGLWYVSTDNGRGGLDKVYPEALCPAGPVIAGACDPRTGDPVAVGTELVEGIDFVLDGIDVFDCIPSDTVLCLNGGRFRVETIWRNAEGLGTPGRRGLLTHDSAYFWFFDDANIEVLVKVLDACGTASNRYWVFAAGLTNVDVSLVVTDTATGRSKEYRNPAGTNFQPILDTDAFSSCHVGFQAPQGFQESAPPASTTRGSASSTVDLRTAIETTQKMEGTCEPGDDHLCLSGNRFRAELTYRAPQSAEQPAPAVQLTDESGYFWFFDARNIEVMVKVLDACYPPYNRFWVFSAGLTNLEVELRVTDTVSGEVRTYNNPANSPFAPIFDISAFDTCG